MPESRDWLRQDSETDKAWRAFKTYRDLPHESSEHPDAPTDRSHRRVREVIYGDSTGTLRSIEEWSRKHDWVRRDKAYDTHLEEQAREQFERERLEDRERRIRTNKALRAKAVRALSDKPLGSMEWVDIWRAIKLANQENRTEYGDEPAQRVELTGKDGAPLQVESSRDAVLAQLEEELAEEDDEAEEESA